MKIKGLGLTFLDQINVISGIIFYLPLHSLYFDNVLCLAGWSSWCLWCTLNCHGPITTKLGRKKDLSFYGLPKAKKKTFADRDQPLFC